MPGKARTYEKPVLLAQPRFAQRPDGHATHGFSIDFGQQDASAWRSGPSRQAGQFLGKALEGQIQAGLCGIFPEKAPHRHHVAGRPDPAGRLFRR